jgi:hypothetical protein
VYLEYDSNIHQTDECPFEASGDLSRYLPVIVAMDFNLNPMCWTLGQERGGQFYWFDEIHLPSSHTPAAATELVERLLGLDGFDARKIGVIICGDSTGNASQRAAAGQSDYDIVFAALEEAGIPYENRTPDANPRIKDRINAMNGRLCNTHGVVSMWHHSRCKYFRRDLEQVGWKEGSLYVLDPGANGELTHHSDGVGYAVFAMCPIEEVHRPGVLHVVRR